MSAIRFFKVGNIPSVLEPNAVYLVNNNTQNVEIYFSDNTGTYLFPLRDRTYTGIGIPNVTRRATPKIVGDVVGAALTNMGLVNGRLYIIPYLTMRPLTLTNLRLGVTTGQAGATVSIGIYSNIALFNGDDNPHTLLAAAHNIPTHSAGDISGAISFTFMPDTLYWVGVISAGSPTLRAVAASSLASCLGRFLNSTSAVAYLYRDLSSSVLPNIAPTDLLAAAGSFPAVYLVQ